MIRNPQADCGPEANSLLRSHEVCFEPSRFCQFCLLLVTSEERSGGAHQRSGDVEYVQRACPQLLSEGIREQRCLSDDGGVIYFRRHEAAGEQILRQAV